MSSISCWSVRKLFSATASASRSRVTVMVRIEPGPNGGVPGLGVGRSRDGNSRR